MVEPTGRAGVYVHVPFCVSHCPYCDFTVAVLSKIPHVQYGDALLAEWRARRNEIEGRTVRTLYFGGGTPALLDVEQIARVIEAVSVENALDEVTLEANPDRCDRARLQAFRDAGVTRLSLGTQSFDDTTLSMLGRQHSGAQAQQVVRDAQSLGFSRLSVDIMTSMPGEPRSRLRRDLDVVRALGVGHVSVYELTIEPKTTFSARVSRGEMSGVDEDEAADDEELVASVLPALGLARYEVGSYGKLGHEGLHNSAYWVGDDYLGLGVGAHSLLVGSGVRRRQNTRSLRAYLRAPLIGGVEEPLSAALHLREVLMTALRTTRGVELADLVRRFPGSPLPTALFDDWRARGWIVPNAGIVAASSDGLSWSDAMASELFAAAIDD
ncbi:MAG: oxygen-independent coproporphyrinogen-3 oxidase [Bradymonadia bacterium]